MTSDSDDLERALQENLKLRHELATNVTKAEAAAASQRPMSASQRVSRGLISRIIVAAEP